MSFIIETNRNAENYKRYYLNSGTNISVLWIRSSLVVVCNVLSFISIHQNIESSDQHVFQPPNDHLQEEDNTVISFCDAV